METSLKTGFAQIFSCCPKNLSCPNFAGAAAPLAPPARTPMVVVTLSWPKILMLVDQTPHPTLANPKPRGNVHHIPRAIPCDVEVSN